MKKNIALLLAAVTSVASIFLWTGCTEEIDGVGRDVLPPSDLINTFFVDTFQIEYETVVVDTVNTYRSPNQLFGSMVDPQMGRLQAATYISVRNLDNLFLGDPGDLFLDSVVFRMQIATTYGRPQELQQIQIYELTDTIPDSTLTNSRTQIPFDNSRNLAQNTEISLNETGQGEFNIRLDDEIGERLLFADTAVLNNPVAFQQLLKGFYITTDPIAFTSREPGAIYSFIGASAGTVVEVFFKRREPNTQAFVSASETFGVTLSTPRFHTVERTEVAGKILEETLVNGGNDDVYEFLEGGALIRNYIKIPQLNKLGQVGISKAVLKLKVDPQFLGSEDRYTPPTELSLALADENGELIVNEDGTLVGLRDLEGGVFPSYDSDEQAYNIVISKYVQEVVSGEISNTGFYILPRPETYRMNRAVLGGLNHPTLKPELEIFYFNFP
ncbi:MAG: DUF4270 family protein [Bacteroidota bacterium]